jgi:hypothetical protein
MSEDSRAIVMDQLLRRIRGEFVEMPGLRLTLEQAQRLWHLDEEICRGLLGALVDLEFLIRDSEGRYGRLSDGALHTERLRAAKADLGSPSGRPSTRRETA